MHFQKGHIYHIYNQGNNRQRIFYKRENYLFFLRKIDVFIKPYGDILAWCLMPNHFHLMMLVNEVDLPFKSSVVLKDNIKSRSLNQSIGIMLRSYTSAVNKQENRTGKLIREKTKTECVTCCDIDYSRHFFADGSAVQKNIPLEKQYPKVCFDYIHLNPVKAKIVKEITFWEFSSARDYYGDRIGKLINKEKAREYGLISPPPTHQLL